MIEVKLSQGAKPGKGGILPGAKVTPEIAAFVAFPPGQDSLSPNRHPEIRDVHELLDFIDRVRGITGKPVGFKTVIGSTAWLEELFQEVTAPRHRVGARTSSRIDSGDGGTGAAPMALIDNVGLPIRESLPADGGPPAQVWPEGADSADRQRQADDAGQRGLALCAGADFVNSARGFMFALGCIQALRCNKNTCPTGITTHDPHLQRGLVSDGQGGAGDALPADMEKEVSVIAHSCGVSEARQLRREHCRIVQGNGRSIPLDLLYPAPGEARAASRAPATEPSPG